MERIPMTTLCYIEKDGNYLMLHRNARKQDINEGKWIGVGGHFKKDESPEECLLREVKEETGLTLLQANFRGIVTFISEKGQTEYMCLYTANKYQGELCACNEGELKWIPKEEVLSLNIWEGDKIFLELLQKDTPFFSLKVHYKGETLVEHELKIYQ